MHPTRNQKDSMAQMLPKKNGEGCFYYRLIRTLGAERCSCVGLSKKRGGVCFHNAPSGGWKSVRLEVNEPVPFENGYLPSRR